MTFKILIINLLTLVRVIGTIILIPVFESFGGIYAGILSLICYLTDSIDGVLARHWNASTFFGSLFDGVADKLFTIVNFIVLYLITPYALIPIFFEIAIILIQFIKYNRKLNVQSNIIGKSKVWVLATCVVLTFLVSDINRITFLALKFRNAITSLPSSTLYFSLLFPALVMEFATFISYLKELIFPKKIKQVKSNKKDLKVSNPKGKNSWESFKNIWLNPKFYDEHKNDTNLKDLRKLSK